MKTKITLIVLLAFLMAYGKVPESKKMSLGKTATVSGEDPLTNRARGYLDKGKLKIAVHNFGRFCGVKPPEGLWGKFSYIPDIDLMVGVPGKDENGNPYPWAVGPKEMYLVKEREFRTFGNDTTYWGPTVSESWMDRTYPNYIRGDWESRADSRLYLHNPLATAGKYYGGKWTDPEDPYPLMATSDIPDTWPFYTDDEGNEVHFWPGPYAIDPSDPEGKKQLKGVFVSDQDLYYEFDDRYATRDIDTTQGYSIGIHAKVSAFSYGATISEDIIFFRMYLYNESEYYYKDMYAGFYFDADAYNTDILGYRYDDSNLNDMMGYDTEYNYAYIYDLYGGEQYPVVKTSGEKLGIAALKLLETPTATKPVDVDGDSIPDIQVGDALGLTSWHWFDWYYRPGAQDNPPNGYSGDGVTPYRPNKEEIQYKIMAGDTSNLDAYDSEHYFHPEKIEVGGQLIDGKLNPRFDSIEGLEKEFPDGLDCVFIMASGPFDMAPGDSVPFSFAVIMGADTTDLKVNARIAQLMYDNNYRGARGPQAPNVTVKEEDRQVTLYWDDVSLHDKDIITGYEDFEGFRIYRSTDNGETWGEQYYDEESRTAYWKPIAQFDLDNDIRGYDRVAPHRFLGDNTGLQFKYVDTDVNNGTEYLYAVCAYDRGFIPGDSLTDPDNLGFAKGLRFEIPSMENLLSNSTILSHIVKAIPHRIPANVKLGNVDIEKKPGTVGNGIFEVEVVTPAKITGHDYDIAFYKDPAGVYKGSLKDTLVFAVVDNVTGDTLFKDSRDYIVDDKPINILPMFDGLRLSITMSSKVDILPDDSYWTENSACTYHLSDLHFSTPTKSQYEIRFVGEDADSVYNLNDFYRKGQKNLQMMVPFQVWNTVTGKKGTLVAKEGNHFARNIEYRLVEYELPEPIPKEYARTLIFTFDWVDPDSLDPITNEPLEADTPWKPGDTMILPVRIPFKAGDTFVLNSSQAIQEKNPDEDDLAKVKVVPNPYLVHAEWETDDFVRKLQFTNLPSKCKIHIFTVTGEKVITLYHNNNTDGSENWDLITLNRQDAAPGLYVYVVEAENGKTHVGKFVIIK